MPSHFEQAQLEHYSLLLNQAINDENFVEFKLLIENELTPSTIAHIIESTPSNQRDVIWQNIPESIQSEVIAYLSDDIQTSFLKGLTPEKIKFATQDLERDDLADLLQQLPVKVSDQVLEVMEPQDRLDIQVLLAYDEDSAGGLMNTNCISVRPNITLEAVLRFLREHKDLPEQLDNLFVTSRHNKLVGVLRLSTLLTHEPELTVREVMNSDIEGILATTSSSEVAQLFERHDYVSAPVVSQTGALVGWITVDDVLDVIREQADHTVLSFAGLDEDEDTFSPAFKSTQRRALWLGINLLTALLASACALFFEATIDEIVALAVLMNLTPSMGGIAGTQTLTIVIRGLALGHISKNNIRWLLGRELIVGFNNGLLWATVIGISVYFWKQSYMLSLIIGFAIWVNLIVSVIAGTLLPIYLKKKGIDPALSGGVILTTITDVVGTFIFLGLASIILLN
ncbi:MAG: magnesium transporter [Saccharospirillaceae bacterium]|nr:magnesium transporter [Pseudomonadales bacterium]NRB79653.1 magnesium transporter [Saccharospirillaceae bacterium]